MAEITRQRKGEMLRKLFDILAQEPEGLRAGKALKSLADSLTLTPHEQATFETGVRRFDKVARFAVLVCARAGWVATHEGTWTLTDAGRAAMKDYPDLEVFYRRAKQLYLAWRTKSQGPMEPPGEAAEELDGQPGTEDSAAITFQEADDQAWGEIEQFLLSMLPYDFQHLVCDLLTGMGHHVLWEAPKGPDGGIDIIASTDPLGTKPPYIKVQVKRTSTPADVDAMKSFAASLGGNDVGIFVAASGFTKTASEYARHQASRPVTLVDLKRLVKLWVEAYPRLTDEARRRLPLKPIYFLKFDG